MLLSIFKTDSNKFVLVEVFVISIIVILKYLGLLPFSATPFLFVAGWIFLKLTKSGWKQIGLKRPTKWSMKKTVIAGLLIAVVYEFLDIYVLEPVTIFITNQKTDLSKFNNVPSNFFLFAIILIGIWTLAAFGEEMIYRGYIMNLLAKVFRNSKYTWAISLIISSLLFGSIHYYEGITGIIGVAITGFLLGAAYLYSDKNLWLPIFIHGFYDTIGLVFLYFGWFK